MWAVCLVTEIKKIGNLFIINNEECKLIQLDTRDVMGPNIVKSIKGIQRREFREIQMHQLTKDKLLFSSGNQSRLKTIVKSKKELKRNRKLFAQLFIAAQVRGVDVEEFFLHETR